LIDNENNLFCGFLRHGASPTKQIFSNKARIIRNVMPGNCRMIQIHSRAYSVGRWRMVMF
ncbi:MAG: hypothetical protein KGQ89_02460, partial [Verrucomicrobia bacterium]|nr:hypothetical protein [Verrucomicrobiota bacterium]